MDNPKFHENSIDCKHELLWFLLFSPCKMCEKPVKHKQALNAMKGGEKMKARMPKGGGTMVMFLETDLKKTKRPTIDTFTPLQSQCYSKLSKEEQEKICEGYGTVIVDLESGDHICEFNMEDYQPPQHAIESFARSLLPMIQEYY